MKEHILEIRNAGKSFGKTEVLRHINFAMRRGEVVGFVGQNGAGKTTLLRLIAGLMKTSSGSIRIDTGKPFVGYMPQSCRFEEGATVEKTIRFFAGMRKTGAPSGIELCRKLELDIAKKVKHLSPGQQKKLQMVIAMTGEPDFYILDEPTAGLDPAATDEILGIIRDLHSRGKSILLSSHILQNMDDVCTGVAIMDKGNLVYDHAIEERYFIKTRPMTVEALAAIQEKYDVTCNDELTCLTLKAGAGDIAAFIKALVLLSADVLEVSASSVRHIVREQMNRKGA